MLQIAHHPPGYCRDTIRKHPEMMFYLADLHVLLVSKCLVAKNRNQSCLVSDLGLDPFLGSILPSAILNQSSINRRSDRSGFPGERGDRVRF